MRNTDTLVRCDLVTFLVAVFLVTFLAAVFLIILLLDTTNTLPNTKYPHLNEENKIKVFYKISQY